MLAKKRRGRPSKTAGKETSQVDTEQNQDADSSKADKLEEKNTFVDKNCKRVPSQISTRGKENEQADSQPPEGQRKRRMTEQSQVEAENVTVKEETVPKKRGRPRKSEQQTTNPGSTIAKDTPVPTVGRLRKSSRILGDADKQIDKTKKPRRNNTLKNDNSEDTTQIIEKRRSTNAQSEIPKNLEEENNIEDVEPDSEKMKAPSLDINEPRAKKQRGRPKKVSKASENSNRQKDENDTNKKEYPHVVSDDEIPKKRKQLNQTTDEMNKADSNAEIKEEIPVRKEKKSGRVRKSMIRYSQSNLDETHTVYSRIDLFSKIKNPNQIVQCEICKESMPVINYQKVHMAKHNYLCWLKDEDPIDIENEILVERILTRIKLYSPKIIFKCPVCQNVKKSARGFISHRQFCGKTEQERIKMMVTCEQCGRMLMPSSMDSHVYLNHHPDNKKSEEKIEITGSRKAAEKCLKNISLFTSDTAPKDKDSQEQFNPDDDLSEFYTAVKLRAKDFSNQWRQAFLKDEIVTCPCSNCDFKAERLQEMKKHFRNCSVHAKTFQCTECEFSAPDEPQITAHIKNLHLGNVTLARQKSKENSNEEDVKDNCLPSIPFLRNTERTFSHSRIRSKFFSPALKWTKEMRNIHFSQEELYSDLAVNMDWEFLEHDQVEKYIQHEQKSIKVTFNGEDWFAMNKYESSLTHDHAAFIFCGGPIFALGWAPGNNRQFLAIGAHLSMSDFYQVSSTCSGPGNIQIWSFGDLANTKQTSFVGTRLEYLICHDFGGAWALEWCPVGCQNDKRMGLLAVASASGSIPLFSVPQPKASSEIRFPACKPQPVLILELGPYEKYQCTRISWSKVKPHRTIAGGFVNGYIALWDLLSTSSLLRRGKILYPFKVFQAHYSIITGLMFSPMSDTHLVSCAHDKFLKYWDLKDTTAPQSKNWRNLSTDVTWLQHWMTCATAVDNIYSAGESTMIFNSIRDFVYEPQSFIANVDSSALSKYIGGRGSRSISGNDWLNAVALSYDNGQINLAFGRRQPLVSHDDRKKYIKVVMEPHLYNFEVKVTSYY
ncbi:uncharacterized protein LOC106673592 [Cimex lectularius]|uniref:C2H2-type domain-containing protein n=1 Tax=Cimex lectularius TaxID=79782 RepID=A0A8I6TK75_CIMLE|nr:uncharacterized protein LOC106673592 [Cimex lectularius]